MTTTHPEVQVLSSVLTAIIIDNGALEQQLHVAYLFAQKLASLGIPVFPVWAPSFEDAGLVCSCNTRTKDGEPCTSCKHPMHNGGHNQGTTDAGLIERWRDHAIRVNGNQPNWGVPAGKLLDGSDLCVIDLDGAEGVSAWNKLLDDAGLSAINPLGTETLKVYTSKGGVHIYLKGSIKQTTSQIAPKVDTRGDGKGFVVSPGSVHVTGTVYTPSCTLDNLVLLPLDPSLKALLESKIGSGKRSVQSRTALAVSPTEMAADEVVTEGSRNTKLTSIAGRFRSRGDSQADIEVLLLQRNMQLCNPPLDEAEVLNIARSVARYEPGPTNLPGAAEAAAAGDTSWMTDLIRNQGKNGEPGAPKATSFHNRVLILRNAAPYAGNLRWNLLSRRPQVCVDGAWRTLDDETIAGCRVWFETEWGMSLSPKDANDALVKAAYSQKVHPVRDYIDAITWDGVSRIDNLLSRYLGVEDTLLNRTYIRRHLIGAVARIMEPGCKMDTILVLCGPQGIGKSTFVSTLSAGWFSSNVLLSHLAEKDTLAILNKSWHVEIEELAGLGKAAVENVKKFLSTREDEYRSPYDIRTAEVPRQNVFWGTTNEQELLRDPTGSRRFWSVICSKGMTPAERVALEEEREQIWAEAAAAYRTGERWWIDPTNPDDATLVGEKAAADEAHTVLNPWIDVVAEAMRTLTALGGPLTDQGVFINNELTKLITLPSMSLRQIQGEVNVAMLALGYLKKRVRIPHTKELAHAWVRNTVPDTDCDAG
jgi:predicted P-loop ATPase